MAGFPWLRFVEAYLVQMLLRTPAFHRAVEKVAKGVHRVRHGIPPEEMGGVKIDQPGQTGFMKHFNEEIRAQLGTAEQQKASGNKITGMKNHQTVAKEGKQGTTAAEQENADAAWQNSLRTSSEPPKQGFMAEYMDALREQVRNNPGRK